jgi:cell division inhibitor SulA
MSKSKEYSFTSGLSLTIAEELQRLDHYRTDESYYRTELRVGRYRNIQRWLEDKIQELEESEDRIEHECAVTGREYI